MGKKKQKNKKSCNFHRVVIWYIIFPEIIQMFYFVKKR